MYRGHSSLKCFRFKKLVAIWEEMGCEKNTTVENGSFENTDEKTFKPTEFMSVIRNLLNPQDSIPTPSTVKKYFSTGELLYHRSSQLEEKINSFEAHIQRPYFDVKPLDDFQLENWHHYLDFVEMQGDFDWVWTFLDLIFGWYLVVSFSFFII